MLSVFSILLGVWAVVTMLSIAEGVFRDTLERVGRLGADRIRGRCRIDGAKATPAVASDHGRCPGDCKQRGANIRRVVPNLHVSKAHDSLRITRKWSQTSVESYAAFIPGSGPDSDAPAVERGRFLRPRADSANREQVAVIGWNLADELFPVRPRPAWPARDDRRLCHSAWWACWPDAPRSPTRRTG